MVVEATEEVDTAAEATEVEAVVTEAAVVVTEAAVEADLDKVVAVEAWVDRSAILIFPSKNWCRLKRTFIWNIRMSPSDQRPKRKLGVPLSRLLCEGRTSPNLA